MANSELPAMDIEASPATAGPPRHPLLDSITSRFQQNRQTTQRRQEEQATKRVVERAHSQYLKQSCSPSQLAKAQYVVGHHVRKNGIKDVSVNAERRIGAFSAGSQTCASSASSLNNQGGNQLTSGGNQSSKRARRNTNQSNGQYAGEHIAMMESMSTKDDDILEINSSLDETAILSLYASDFVECDFSNNSNNFTCSVLNCEAAFTSEGALGQHMNMFKHSPCNPCLKVRDCKLAPDALCFMCPECDREFPSRHDCNNHMTSKDHCTYLPPLEIVAYTCPQCLYLFESFMACWSHMEQTSHQTMTYPFTDDNDSEGGVFGPVPVPEHLVQDFCRRCEAVPFKVQCLECSMLIDTPAVLRHHMLETHKRHVVSSLTESNVMDVFSSYMSRYSCDMCHRLFNNTVTEQAEHQCSRGMVGKITENDTNSFSEFIKRCALSLVKSVDMNNEPGTSQQSAQSPPRYGIRKNKSRSHKSRSNSRSRRQISHTKTCTSPRSCTIKQLQLQAVRDQKHVFFEISDSEEEDEDTSSFTSNSASSHSTGTKRKTVPSGAKPGEKRITLGDQRHTEDIVIDLSDSDTTLTGSSKSYISSKSGGSSKSNLKPNTFNKAKSFTSAKSCSTSSQVFYSAESVLEPSQPQPSTSTATAPSAVNEFFTGAKLTCQLSPVNIVPDLSKPPPSFIPATRQTQNLTTSQTSSTTLHPASPNVHLQQTRYPLRNQVTPSSGYVITTDDLKMALHSSPPDFTDFRNHLPARNNKDSRSNRYNSGHEAAQQTESLDRRQRSRSPLELNESPIANANLMRMRHIIFLDLDNWPNFFSKLPRVLPDLTFVWGFYGGKHVWKEPYNCYVFDQMKKKKLFHLHARCGSTKDAADFAIVLAVGTMHERLPKDIAFTILSGDKGFLEVERQMRHERRRAIVIDPHTSQRHSGDMIYIMCTSVTDT